MSDWGWAETLNTVGALLEFVGIVLVADRGLDLINLGRDWLRGLLERIGRGPAADEYLPATLPYQPRGLPRTTFGRVEMRMNLTMNAAATVRGTGTHDERLARIEDQLAKLLPRFGREMDDRIQEGAKDRWGGIIILFLGVSCVWVANVAL